MKTGKTFGQLKQDLIKIGCENPTFTNYGIMFHIGSLRDIEIRYNAEPFGLCLYENGKCKIVFAYDYTGMIEHLERVIENEKRRQEAC